MPKDSDQHKLHRRVMKRLLVHHHQVVVVMKIELSFYHINQLASFRGYE